MKYKPYPEYKPSGVEWIGDIPVGWNTLPIKRIVSIPITDGPHETPELFDEGIPFVSAEAVKNEKLDFSKKRGFISLQDHVRFSKKYKPKKGDIYMVKSGATTGNIAMVETDEEFNIWSPLAVVRPDQKKMNSMYVFNFMKSKSFFQSVELAWSYGTQQNIGMGVIENLPMVVPSLDEQQQIANFLDQKTGQIDDLIQKKEKMIKLLKEKRAALINQTVTKGLDPNAKMKPSGIDWIGDIPQEWDVFKLKYLTQKIGSGITPKGGAAIYENEGIPLLRSQNIHFNALRLDDVAYISEEIHQNMIATEVHEGDVLFNITGASIGRCNYWPKDIGIANVNQHVCIVRPSALILTKYLYFLLSSDFVQQQVWLSQDGSSREGLNFADFGCFAIIVPKIEEQQKVLKFLESKISEINMLIQKIESAITKLHEYRSSIITAAVTGKIDVRDGR